MNKNVSIMIVDDNQENLKVVSNFLKDKGYNLALALDGESALEILRSNAINLILLDIMMPKMNGYEVCKLIKKDKLLSDIPVIFLTAKNQSDDLQEAFSVGGVDYITKPFFREELLARIETHLDLSLSKKKLQQTIVTRDKLYSIIAHDIRAPFSNISILINLVSKGGMSADSAEFKDIMMLLEKSTRETTTLLNNLLEWTKLQIGTITLKPQLWPIGSVIGDCVQLLNGNAINKNIRVTNSISEESLAFFDEVTMHTVFRNILSNALKFTPENGTIDISASQTDTHIVVQIKDSGVGISAEVLHKMFHNNELYSSQGTQNEMGSGLGLFLVKDLIEQNKGTLNVQSTVNAGSTFTVTLPLFLL